MSRPHEDDALETLAIAFVTLLAVLVVAIATLVVLA